MDSKQCPPLPEAYFSESAVATFIISPEHAVIFWNKACEELTGLPASQVLMTRNHWRAFYDEERPCLADIVIDGNVEDLPRHYEKFGVSTLARDGIRAEGWFDNLGGKRRYIIFDAAPIYNDQGQLVSAIETLQDISALKETEQEDLVAGLQSTIAGNKTLTGYLPICSSCKNIRDKEGCWIEVESYFRDEAGILFSHGICPACIRKLYPEFYDKLQE